MIPLISAAFFRDFTFGYLVVFLPTLVLLFALTPQGSSHIYVSLVMPVMHANWRAASGYVGRGGCVLSPRQIRAGATASFTVALIFQVLAALAFELHLDGKPVLAVGLTMMLQGPVNLFWGFIFLPISVKSEIARQNKRGTDND